MIEVKLLKLFETRLFFLIFITALMTQGCAMTANAPYVNASIEKSYALMYIEEIIKIYESALGRDPYTLEPRSPETRIIDSRIVEFERVAEFDYILPHSIGLWFLDFHLKLEDVNTISLDVKIEDGWITASNETSAYLIFSYESKEDGKEITYLGYIPRGILLHSNLDTPWGKEIAIRSSLELWGMLPPSTFLGNQYIVHFLSGELLLSQPVIQGENGIWTVERWCLTNDLHTAEPVINHSIPLSEEKTMLEYFRDLQSKVDAGYDLWLLQPYKVARKFIDTHFSPNHMIISASARIFASFDGY